MIFGSEGDDLLEGMPGADDIIHGGDGDDTLRGGGGADYLTGGAGADEIDGGEDAGRAEFFGSFRNYVWGDTAQYVDSDAGVTIDLATGTAEGGHAEGDTLIGIESIRGSDHADTLVARNEGSTLYGQEGDDSLSGGDGADYLWGGKGDDTLMGGAGGDYLEGGAAADVLDGGSGFNWVGYELSDAGVTINLATGEAEGGHADGDTLTGLRGVFGSSHADRLTGDANVNVIVGGAGADTLDGGDGWDQIAYLRSDAGVTVNLATGEVEGGSAEGDILTGFESVWGSRHADRLIGDGRLVGWLGNDTLEGGAGDGNLEGHAGADMIDGGDGWDAADYRNSDAGVTVNLATGMGQGGHAEGDTLITGIEAINGSNHADHLIGNDWNNRLEGRAGDDILEGRAGDDHLDGGPGSDNVQGGAGNDNLRGGSGGDMLDGGDGDDWAHYWESDAGVTVNLATGTAQGGHAEGDTLTGIESINGSNHADHLTGNDWNNRLEGRGGDDTLVGGAGDDVLRGGPGADMLDGGGGDLDTAAYWGSDTGVTVNLATGTGQGGDAEGDTLTAFRSVFGSDHADHLTARNDDPNTEEAEGTILHGGDGDDTLQGGTGTDHLAGEGGADRLDGGAGVDYAAYWESDAGVTVNLATGTGQGGHAEGDTLTEFERIHGSDHADHLTGDDRDNVLHGEAGNDTLDGGAGNDWLLGEAGEDLLTGGDGADKFVFADGDTITDFEDGSDVIEITYFGHITADNFEANVAIRQSGSDVEVQIGDAVVTLNGVSAADLTVDDFVLA